MIKTDLKVGDVVQINPKHDPLFGGHLMVVTEPKEWGAQGYCLPLELNPGLACYRCSFENMEYVGCATWVARLKGEERET